MTVIHWQRLEGAGVLLGGVALYVLLGPEFGWWAIAIFLLPDLSFAGYAAGPRVGAAVYNAAHLYACGAVLMAVGVGVASPVLVGLGALWLAHVGFDRLLGYGLKHDTDFKHTHMGDL